MGHTAARLAAGYVIADRFVVEDIAGTGGMATVYRARDRANGATVALKLLLTDDPEQSRRFVREAHTLAELRHPSIVRYIAHGTTDDGQPYLAMEWLDGEDLSDRLRRPPGLTIAECVQVAERAAVALAHAHERGVIHRDIKPSNLFLVDGDVRGVRVLDFGIARLRAHKIATTAAGALLGTPGYMSPEQARGAPDIDARTDVFSLGCVLYECLAGQPPFIGSHPVAILGKILFDDPPPVGSLRKGLTPRLEALVERCLSKDAAARPDDARAFVASVRDLGPLDDVARPRHTERPASLTTGEQRLVSVVIAGRVEGFTRDLVGHDVGVDISRTLPIDPREAVLPDAGTAHGPLGASTVAASAYTTAWIVSLRESVARFGAQLELLIDGSVVVTLSRGSVATDQAATAARCALSLRARLGDVPIVLTTGRAMVTRRLPVGEVIDRGVALLARAPTAESGANVTVDDVTAGLLDARFELRVHDGRCSLVREREDVEVRRTLLGRATPCVGRDRELSFLTGLYDECVGDPGARVVLVTALPGVGKSRLRHEFVRALQDRREPFSLWLALGDPMRAGSPFGMLGRAIRRAAAILDGEPTSDARRKLVDFVARRVHAGEQSRVAEFVGEMIGVSATEPDSSVPLRAARHEPQLMSDQIRRGFEDLVAAECAAHPLVLVLDDLHWGDLPSVQAVDAALRMARDQPLFVLALARPEVAEQFPKLWTDRGVQSLGLTGLSRKAAERLVRASLGDDASPVSVARLVDRADGNAFYLEELIRAVASGHGDALPETVLAMAHSRLASLDALARRLLRAASVFGVVFWRGAVESLVGAPDDAAERIDLDAWLEVLCEREVVVKRSSSKFPGETEYAFGHGLLREAAYASLTQEDRSLGHCLAGAWLEAAGEREAMVLAEHYVLGGQADRAVESFRHAAMEALRGGDFAAAIDRARRGIASGAREGAAGALALIEAEAHAWCGQHDAAAARAASAMTALEPGSAAWCGAAGLYGQATGALNRFEDAEAHAGRLAAQAVDDGAQSAMVVALGRACLPLIKSARLEAARRLAARLDTLAGDVPDDPVVRAWVSKIHIHEVLYPGGPENDLDLTTRAREAFLEAGDLRAAYNEASILGDIYKELGCYETAEDLLRDAIAGATRMGLATVLAMARQNLGFVLDRLGRYEEARVVETAALEQYKAQSHARMVGASATYLSTILLHLGDLDGAAQLARDTVASLSAIKPTRATALAALARIELARGRASEALDAAEAAHATLTELGRVEEGEARIRLVYAEALEAAGKRAESRGAIRDARTALVARAEKLQRADLRESFVERVEENAKILILAGRWLSRGL